MEGPGRGFPGCGQRPPRCAMSNRAGSAEARSARFGGLAKEVDRLVGIVRGIRAGITPQPTWHHLRLLRLLRQVLRPN